MAKDFNVKKFLQENKIGPYGLIKESKKKKSLKENYIDLQALCQPMGMRHTAINEEEVVEEQEIEEGKKQLAFVIPCPDCYDIDEEAEHFQYLLDKAGVKAKAKVNMVGEEVEVYTKDEKKARKVIEKNGYQIGWNEDHEDNGQGEPTQSDDFGGYTKTLKEDDTYLGPKKPQPHQIYNTPQGEEEYAQENSWMEDVHNKRVGDWTVNYEYPGILVWNCEGYEDDFIAIATPKWEGLSGTPVEIVDLFPEGTVASSELIEVVHQDEFVSLEEYAEAIFPVLDRFVKKHGEDYGEYSNSIEEDVDDEDFESDSPLERAESLVSKSKLRAFEDSVETIADELSQDGFDESDIREFFNHHIAGILEGIAKYYSKNR